MTHFGVYAIVREDDKILVVNKETGPYKQRFDLPGGSRKTEKEGLIETLKRELVEEVGGKLVSIQDCNTYDFCIKPTLGPEFLHIAVFYDIEISLNSNFHISKIDSSGELNDSSGRFWSPVCDISIDNSSPLLIKVKDIITGQKLDYSTTYYNNWSVLDV